MTIKQQLIAALERVLHDFDIEITPTVDYPADPNHGDYSTNVALMAAKKLGKNPMEVAEDLRFKIKDISFIEKLDVVNPGFINFWVKQEVLLTVIPDLIRNPESTLDSRMRGNDNIVVDIGKGKKVVVEYSSPNIAKPFTIGHLRSTVIGDAVANLLEATGWKVYRDNHLGDWGTQFGKQIYAIKEWGNEDEIKKAERPVKLLVDLYVKFHEEAEKNPQLEDEAREWFKKMENGDEEARKLWQKCIEWSWREFKKIYKTLEVSFTENDGKGYGESFFEDKMSTILHELKEKNVLRDGEEGAKIVEFPEETKLPPLMILKKDGATLYSTRDLATDKFRLSHYGNDVTIINEVGSEQSLYFRQLYKLEEMLGWYKEGQRIHKKHGLYRFKDGKMSTRKGNVIWLEDVLYNATNNAMALMVGKHEFKTTPTVIPGVENIEILERKNNKQHTLHIDAIKKNGQLVGIGALKWNDLKRSSEQDIVFDWDEILNMQGNSGPYIQYTFARTQSVIAKSGGLPRSSAESLAMTKGLEPEERELLRLLSRFPEIVQEAATRLAPNIVCTYLFELAQAFNLFYQKHQILKAEGELLQFRLALTSSTGTTLKKGLNLLGIQAPEKM